MTMTGNCDILLKYSLGELTAAQAMRRLHVTDEQSLNKLTIGAKLPLPKLSVEETDAMQKRFGEMLDKAAVKLEPWYLVESANKILCKHQFHRAFDQEFTYKADPIAKTLDVHVDELDVMLLKWFLYIHAPNLINPDLNEIDDYTIIVYVREQYTFAAKLLRSEHDWQQDTVVLMPVTLVDDLDGYRKYLSETLKRDPKAGMNVMREIAQNSTVIYPDEIDFEESKDQ